MLRGSGGLRVPPFARRLRKGWGTRHPAAFAVNIFHQTESQQSRQSMNVRRFAPIAAAILFCGVPHQSQARAIVVLTYQQMLEKSDLVVIATPKSKTTDTKEQSFLPGIWQQDKDGKQCKIKSIGVETVFAVSAVLKGDATLKQFTLHHYREAQINAAGDGPFLVSFHHQTCRSAVPTCFFLFANQMVASPQSAGRQIPALNQSADFSLNRISQAAYLARSISAWSCHGRSPWMFPRSRRRLR